jgi:hypothetical protein
LGRGAVLLKNIKTRGFGGHKAKWRNTMKTLEEVKRNCTARFGKPLRKDDLEKAILAERLRFLTQKGCNPLDTNLDVMGMVGSMECDLKFYTFLWGVSRGRPGLGMARDKALNGDWSAQVFLDPRYSDDPELCPETKEEDFWNDHFRFYGRTEAHAFQNVEFCLIYERLYHVDSESEIDVIKYGKYPRFPISSLATLRLLHELYVEFPQLDIPVSRHLWSYSAPCE